MKQNIYILLVLIALFACKKKENVAPLDKQGEQKNITLSIDGISRSFIVYLPTGYNNTAKLPLVFVMHGGSGTPDGMINIANFKPIAERDKVILVYPAGIENNWNDGRPTPPNLLGINDVGFFDQLCGYMAANYPVDETKIYATGISNGGFMASRLGCELSNRFAAIAVVAATIEATTIAPYCNPNKPVPALYIHGTKDTFVPFNGGKMTVGAGGNVLSHFQAIDNWVRINGCNNLPTETNLPDISNDGTTIKQRVYANPINGAEVVSYVVMNGGHTWPQGYQYLNEFIIGKTSQDMNACEVIWAFFKRFQRH